LKEYQKINLITSCGKISKKPRFLTQITKRVNVAEKPTYEELQQKVKKLEQETEKYRKAEGALREIKHQAQQYFAIAGVIFLTLDRNGSITLR